jgi:hypothetical protein
MTPILLIAAMAVRLGSNVPAHEPQVASTSSLTGLTFGAGNTIYFSSSHDGGRTFAAPIKVGEAGILPLSRHRGPRIAISGDTIVITAVAGSKPEEGGHAHGLPSDGDLLVWRSQDGGKTWSRGKAINDVPASATEGLHALATDGKGVFFAVWLDKRAVKGTRLYSARSEDGGVSWSRNVAVYESPDGSICECCHPSVAIDDKGETTVMWRNAVGGARDMYLATSPDGVKFPTPRKLGNGTWKLNACPMDGGGLAVSGSRILTAWRRDTNVFLAEPGQPERQVGTGKDVAIALNGDRAYVAWVNGSKVEAWIEGKVEQLSDAGAFPSLASLPGGGVLAAWEENGGIQIRRLP